MCSTRTSPTTVERKRSYINHADADMEHARTTCMRGAESPFVLLSGKILL